MTKHEELIASDYRRYQGEDVDVYFNKEICTHSGNCVQSLPEVFDVKRKPWIRADREQANQVIETIKKCPSGALQYVEKRDVQ
ncbi:(4Fe-4S)-binding protein [Alkalihalobacillus pseudalcaliphilus]|uniref:(4Fe-4S)-binding protein n=1 Tax=Alkalihalobacillus pseudalcaliphilus TaxID=79884 RepID=UPI00064DDDD1|nr:(4Fe-4S)-binding protein [Alkalihalobacillus pseudalcaliphilus]KMK77163.1 hypothetical protein AB990_06330 [Alkalihalobacillus pseudalcaliphilus]